MIYILNLHPKDGLNVMSLACEAIETNIKAAGGTYTVQMAPKVVTAMDEADLARQLERAEMENAEVRRVLLENWHNNVLQKGFLS